MITEFLDVSFIARENYHSLMDHLGSGREWDLVRKNGGLNIIPPFAQKSIKIYNGSIEALESIKGFIKNQTEKLLKQIILSNQKEFQFVAQVDAFACPAEINNNQDLLHRMMGEN